MSHRLFRSIPSCFKTLLVLSLLASCARILFAQDAASEALDTKLKMDFYTLQQRLKVILDAALFVPTATGEADIASGPTQDKKQFQLHFNDKVICDFTGSLSFMSGVRVWTVPSGLSTRVITQPNFGVLPPILSPGVAKVLGLALMRDPNRIPQIYPQGGWMSRK